MNTHTLDTTRAPQEQRIGMVLAHLLALMSSIIGALIFWLVTKDDNDTPFVQDQAREVLNFQLNVIAAYMISSILMLVLIGFLLLPVVAIGSFILMMIGAIKASRGESHRYPFIIRLIKN